MIKLLETLRREFHIISPKEPAAWGWRADLAVQSTHCSFRGKELSSQLLLWAAHSERESDTSGLPGHCLTCTNLHTIKKKQINKINGVLHHCLGKWLSCLRHPRSSSSKAFRAFYYRLLRPKSDWPGCRLFPCSLQCHPTLLLYTPFPTLPHQIQKRSSGKCLTIHFPECPLASSA